MAKTKYQLIYEQLTREIINGDYPQNTALPNERILSTRFKVSRQTIRKAIGLLSKQGLIFSKVGSGNYVSSKKITEQLAGVQSFTDLMRQLGKQPTSKITHFSINKATEKQAKALKIKINESVVNITRIRFGDLEPIAYEINTLPSNLFAEFSQEQVAQSLYESLSEFGYEIGYAQQRFSARLTTSEIAQALSISQNQPVMYLEQTTYLTNSQPFEFVQTTYNGNLYELFIEQKKN